MGEMRVPDGALYGAQTARAVENFPISGQRLPRAFIRALGLIKSAAATVNGRMGHLPEDRAKAIEAAAEEVAAGRHDDQFVVDIFQTGSGTSTNMNANEVIGRLAKAHPNDDVNRGQSSNDVIPSAMHIAAAEADRTAPVSGDARSGAVAGPQGRRVRRHPQDRPHALAGRRAHAPGAGVQRVRAAGGGRPPSAWRRRCPASTNCRWAARRSAPGSMRPRGSPARSSQKSPAAPACRSSKRPTISKPRRRATPCVSSAARCAPTPWRSPRSPTTFAGWARVRAAVWAS